MTFTIRRSTLVVLVCLVVVAAGVFVAQRASAASATPVVYVATGENFPDALGAASAAAVQGGPVLLVRQNSIPGATKGELSRLSPDVIYVAGGSDVVSDAVLTQLEAYAGSVIRVQGDTRYETAVEVSKSAFPVTGGGGSAALEARVAALEAEIDALQAMLAGVSRNGDILEFSGMNLQVVNGTGTTDGTPNSLGNVIIGYNENNSDTRTGSHNLVIGRWHSWSSHSGIVAGYNNTISGHVSSVTGGEGNTASRGYSSVSGGEGNTASGYLSSVSGGVGNTASGYNSSVSGGVGNTASGGASSVSGGSGNTASGDVSSVSGGVRNTASGAASSVTGGYENIASGGYSYVIGGTRNVAAGNYDGVLGGDDVACDAVNDKACGEATVTNADA